MLPLTTAPSIYLPPKNLGVEKIKIQKNPSAPKNVAYITPNSLETQVEPLFSWFEIHQRNFERDYSLVTKLKKRLG